MTKTHTKRVLAALTASLLSLSLLAACGGQDSAADASTQPDAGQAQTEQTDQTDQTSKSTVTTVGEFTTQDLDGNTVTQEIFKEHKLTLVNAMGTWCSPCVQELPELQKLYENMKDKGVGVISIVTDTLGADNKPDHATYPFLVPDAGWLNGRLANMETFPESFFVDENGNIVGEPSFGSHDLAEWTSIVENALANLDQGA